MAALIRRIISTAKAPAAIGPYSQAVVVDRTMYISGQLGMDPVSGQLVDGGVQAQTRQFSRPTSQPELLIRLLTSLEVDWLKSKQLLFWALLVMPPNKCMLNNRNSTHIE
ncbi:2-iminobutanoate/2-iminopropanoate deaminase isoform X3 [Kryptolebias marmoratus]|uniref:2-iminobutanoate/2-iminopropanoate deaminase isoform X3 n=1 Tax=Kryptolebias marmoratus TaxID=37003 RepID=UPI0018AC9639|nr:2-iminobutanoate/2-iminopropanoate deaminase isoform X3 [Kryptolebias marmoratus]